MGIRSYGGIVIVVALLVGCTQVSNRQAASVKSEKDRRRAPDFALKDMNGQTAKLSDYRGKVVLVNFWATWCSPCQVEIPWFKSFEQSYKDRDFAVLGVSMDDDGWTAVKPYLVDHKINYRVVIGTEELTQLYGGVDALPTTFIIDREGRIASVHIGLVSKSEYQNEILKLLDSSKNDGSKDAPKTVSVNLPALR
jgi:peroxiredoxin